MSAPERRYRRVADGVNAPPIRTQWAGRVEGPFPEVAEVLGIETDLVMSALEMGGTIAVLFTPDRETAEDPEAIRGLLLGRDADGVLRKLTEPEPVPEVTKAMKELLSEG
jgi:hypothetical protein